MPLIRKTSPGGSSPTLQSGGSVPVATGGADLAAAFVSDSDDDRWNAARQAPETAEGLLLLRDALSRESVPRIRQAIFTRLARIGTPDSAAIAIACLRSDDAATRTSALDALRAMPAAAAGHLPQLLRDADADVRLLACEIARALPTAVASDLLGELLAREDRANVCAAAVEVLAEAGDVTNLPVLAACVARFPDDPFLGFAVQIASDRIRSR